MKNINGWQKFLAVTASLTLAAIANVPFRTAASTALPVTPEQTSFQKEAEYKLAQTPANCRRVLTRGSDLNVRSSPNGTITGSLNNGAMVTVEGTSNNGWMMISAPQKGMVFDTYLTSCDTSVSSTTTTQAMTSGESCRQILSSENVSIRKEPSMESTVLGTLSNRQTVTLINRGINGWVPISAPVNGFIPASVLIYCR